MDKNQKINCTVSNCKFNNNESQKCILEQIVVTPMEDTQAKTADESMCSSYENEVRGLMLEMSAMTGGLVKNQNYIDPK